MGHSASEQLQYGTLVTPLELACRIPQTELPKQGVSFWKKLEIITIFLSKQNRYASFNCLDNKFILGLSQKIT